MSKCFIILITGPNGLLAEPQVFVYTETETNPVNSRSNNSLRSVANRRKLNSNSNKTNQGGSIETEI